MPIAFVKVAAEYAQNKYDDFAAVVQPFFSGANSEKIDISFLSNVSAVCQKTKRSRSTDILLFSPAGLLPSLPGSSPEHGQSSVEQHDHSSCSEEDLFCL